MDTSPTLPEFTATRRTVLIAGAGGAGLAVLTACASGGGAQAGGAPPADPTSPAHGPGGGSPAGTGGATGNALATLADITVGKCIAVNLPDGQPAIVSRPTATTARCFSAICTHQGCTVNPAGAQLNCPCHGSQYNALTGQVLQGPAPSPLPEIGVKVQNGKVVTT